MHAHPFHEDPIEEVPERIPTLYPVYMPPAAPERGRVRRAMRRASYHRIPSPHGHWLWIVGLYLFLTVMGLPILVGAPAFFVGYCGVAGSVVFFSALYGVIRSATR